MLLLDFKLTTNLWLKDELKIEYISVFDFELTKLEFTNEI